MDFLWELMMECHLRWDCYLIAEYGSRKYLMNDIMELIEIKEGILSYHKPWGMGL